MYPNQNTMSYPNQVQSQIAEQLLFQNQSSANIADIYKALDTVLSNMDIPNTAETANIVLGIIQPQIMESEQKQSGCNRYEQAGGNAD